MWCTARKAHLRGCMISISLFLGLSSRPSNLWWPAHIWMITMSYGDSGNSSSIWASRTNQEAAIYPTHREMLRIGFTSNICGRDIIAFVRSVPNVSCCSPVFNWRQEKEEEYEVISCWYTQGHRKTQCRARQIQRVLITGRTACLCRNVAGCSVQWMVGIELHKTSMVSNFHLSIPVLLVVLNPL